MIHHVVLFKWKSETPEGHAHLVSESLRTLPAAIPQIKSYAFGANVGVADGNWDYGVHAEFDSIEGWQTYSKHDEHVRIVVEQIAPWLADRAVAQFSD